MVFKRRNQYDRLQVDGSASRHNFSGSYGLYIERLRIDVLTYFAVIHSLPEIPKIFFSQTPMTKKSTIYGMRSSFMLYLLRKLFTKETVSGTPHFDIFNLVS